MTACGVRNGRGLFGNTERNPQYCKSKMIKVASNDDDAVITQIQVDSQQKQSRVTLYLLKLRQKTRRRLSYQHKIHIFEPREPESRQNLYYFLDVENTAVLRGFKGEGSG